MQLLPVCKKASRRFTNSQRSRGGCHRATKVRASRRAVKTDLLEMIESGVSKREAARRVGLPESTARGILANDAINPILPNLHSRGAVPRASDRHHAARQRELTPKRVAALHSLYREPREARDVRIKTRPHRPRREVVPHIEMAPWFFKGRRFTAREMCAIGTSMFGAWFGRPGTEERIIVDARRPEHDYRIHGFASARSGICSNRFSHGR